MPVYISSNCISGEEAAGVLDNLALAGIKNVELGARAVSKNTRTPEVTRYGFNLLAHNYFISPDEPIILNLSSPDKVILARSREYMIQAIDFCYGAGIKLFTIHAGFRADPDLSLKFNREGKFTPYKQSFETFVESVKAINDYAAGKNIRVGIENNVLSEANLVNGKNKLLLLCEAEEFEELWQRIPSDNLGMLLDLGHLKVTARSLKFDRYKFIERVKDKVFAFHIHDNDERIDDHKKLDGTSWCFNIITQTAFSGLPVILESLGLNIKEAVEQIRLIETALETRK